MWSMGKTVAMLLLLFIGFLIFEQLRRRSHPVRLLSIAASTAANSPSPKTYKIPLVIHQTHKTKKVPERMGAAIGEWVAKNPEFIHRYYDDADLEQYIRKHGDDRTNQAYDTLVEKFPNKGAMRADLFRLVLMKTEGGVYADVDTTPKRSLLEIIDSNDDYVTGVGRRNDAHQWILITVPGHPFISKALDLAVDAILEDRPEPGGIGRHAGFAGPPMLDRAIRETMGAYGREKDMTPGTHEIDGEHTYRVLKGDLLGGNVTFKYEGYREDLQQMGLRHWTVA